MLSACVLQLEEVYAYRVSQVLSTMPAELLANLQATFRNSDTNPIITAIAPLGDAICHRISEQCSGGLNHVRGIMQTYRMTNKEWCVSCLDEPAPRTHSSHAYTRL